MGERVNTYNVNIQVNGEEYTVTADSLQSALRLTLAFLLNKSGANFGIHSPRLGGKVPEWRFIADKGRSCV